MGLGAGWDEARGMLQVPENEVLRVGRPHFIRLDVCGRIGRRDDPNGREFEFVELRVSGVEQRAIHLREALLL